MMAGSSLPLHLLVTGFALGWSVAWPPGPINAEAIRRGLYRQFWPAYAVVIGGCCGDAFWALVIGIAADRLRLPRLQQILGATSVLLLGILAIVFFRGAWIGWKQLQERRSVKRQPPAHSGRSFAVGFTLALTSPWSIAFWIAVIGQTQSSARGSLSSAIVAAGVVAGAATWGLLLCSSVVRLGARVQNPGWEIVTQLVTGSVMVGFALRVALKVAAR